MVLRCRPACRIILVATRIAAGASSASVNDVGET